MIFAVGLVFHNQHPVQREDQPVDWAGGAQTILHPAHQLVEAGTRQSASGGRAGCHKRHRDMSFGARRRDDGRHHGPSVAVSADELVPAQQRARAEQIRSGGNGRDAVGLLHNGGDVDACEHGRAGHAAASGSRVWTLGLAPFMSTILPVVLLAGPAPRVLRRPPREPDPRASFTCTIPYRLVQKWSARFALGNVQTARHGRDLAPSCDWECSDGCAALTGVPKLSETAFDVAEARRPLWRYRSIRELRDPRFLPVASRSATSDRDAVRPARSPGRRRRARRQGPQDVI